MKIAQLAPPWISIPPKTYGGTELIISWLCDELVRRGHEVWLFATGDSKTKAKLVPVWPSSLWNANLRAPHAVFSLMYQKFLETKENFDIIHDHCEWYTCPFSKFLKAPIVTTLHHPLTEEAITLYRKFPNINFVAISRHQKKQAPGVNVVKVIYHGLPLEKYPFNEKPKDYLLWLSRIGPDKGTAEAIEIAKLTGENLIIAGPILPQFADYFEFRIKPLIDGKKIRFVGSADFRKKIELFKNAKAFLFPVKRPEPFGLVVIEAMACGTPVIGFKQGSLEELVEDKKTGFLVKNLEEACQAVKKIGEIKRKDCRARVEKNFGLKRMVNRYEKLYKKIIKKWQNSKSPK